MPRPQIVARALVWLSWLGAGTAALSAASELAILGADDGFAALLAQRGFALSALAPARLLATTLRIGRCIALPGVALAILAGALARSGAGLFGALVLSVQVLGYSALLGATLAVLARWSALLQPQHARLLLFALVLVPELRPRHLERRAERSGLFRGAAGPAAGSRSFE